MVGKVAVTEKKEGTDEKTIDPNLTGTYYYSTGGIRSNK